MNLRKSLPVSGFRKQWALLKPVLKSPFILISLIGISGVSHGVGDSGPGGITPSVTSTSSLTGANLQNLSGWQVNPGAGVFYFDKDQALEDSSFSFIGVEYLFKQSWSLELNYSQNATETDTARSADFDQYSLMTYYYFKNHTRWLPYASVGVGRAESEIEQISDTQVISKVKTEDNYVNAGIGSRYYFTDALSLRGDLRGFREDSESITATAVTLTLSYLFAGNARSKPHQPDLKFTRTVKDADQDGVNDVFDLCVDTPMNTIVNERGCAVISEIDEQKSAEPEGVLADADSDGVVDEKDICPETPAQAEVDPLGCMVQFESLDEEVAVVPVVEEEEEKLVGADKKPISTADLDKMLVQDEKVDVNLDVKFGNNTSYLDESYFPEIQRLAEFMLINKTAKVRIEGHSDNLGAAGYNQFLSQKRADRIKEILIERFQVPATQLTAVGFGEAKPLADNNTAEGRSKNRRVTAVVIAEQDAAQ